MWSVPLAPVVKLDPAPATAAPLLSLDSLVSLLPLPPVARIAEALLPALPSPSPMSTTDTVRNAFWAAGFSITPKAEQHMGWWVPLLDQGKTTLASLDASLKAAAATRAELQALAPTASVAQLTDWALDVQSGVVSKAAQLDNAKKFAAPLASATATLPGTVSPAVMAAAAPKASAPTLQTVAANKTAAPAGSTVHTTPASSSSAPADKRKLLLVAAGVGLALWML